MKIFALVIANEEGGEWEILCATRSRALKAFEDFAKEECEGDISLLTAAPLADDAEVRAWNGPDDEDEHPDARYAWAIVETEVLE